MYQALESRTNQFRGVEVIPDALPEDPMEFRRRLDDSLRAWSSEGLLAVWLRVPIDRSALIPVAVEAGFTFHHSGDDYLMLTHRLVEGAQIPPFATHFIGAGGVVINDQQELLVVRERYGVGGRPPALKLPGGALLPGEHLADSVVREVLEETGVRTRFESLAYFRHWHGCRYGKSDIYFVCRLSPLSNEITMQAEELDECLWTPLEEFLGAESIGVFNKSIVRAALENTGLAPVSMDGYPNTGERECFMPPALIGSFLLAPEPTAGP
jgi:8-oxo-dGTP diphosphatase